MINSYKGFDLNIEKILENWEVFHAIREIIANAIDEQIITKTQEIEIKKDENNIWHIIDYGRGIHYKHLTQNENIEKINNDKLIGRFGVGLKDSLATLYRNNVKIQIISKHGAITIKQLPKAGFEDIMTLHAEINHNVDKNMCGTDIRLDGCVDEDIEKAKNLFLCFKEVEILEETKYGHIIKSKDTKSCIYINGVKVADEPNFLFSYNITSLTKQLKRAMNRERNNISRNAYTDRVKSILLETTNEIVIQNLIDDMKKFSSGEKHDETSWVDIQLFVTKQASLRKKNVSFVTTDDLKDSPDIIDDMNRQGYNTVVVPNNVMSKINKYNSEVKENNGESIIKTSITFIEEENSRLISDYIEYPDLSYNEQKIYDSTHKILNLIGGLPLNVKEIRICEKIYDSESIIYSTLGLWDEKNGRIIIKRSQLENIEKYASTLLYECAHAISGKGDVDRGFEMQLTNFLGVISNRYFYEYERQKERFKDDINDKKIDELENGFSYLDDLINKIFND